MLQKDNKKGKLLRDKVVLATNGMSPRTRGV